MYWKTGHLVNTKLHIVFFVTITELQGLSKVKFILQREHRELHRILRITYGF